MIQVMLIAARPEGLELHDDFVTKILPKLREDNISKTITNDSNILYVENKLYQKLMHKKEKRTTIRSQVRTEMRMLATIYIELSSLVTFKKNKSLVSTRFVERNLTFYAILLKI